MIFEKNGIEISSVCFGHNLISEGFGVGSLVDILCSINVNEFRGNKTVQLIVRDIDFSEWSWNEIDQIEREFYMLKSGEYTYDDIPTRLEFASLYKLLRDKSFSKGKQITLMKLLAPLPEISFLKALIILEVFAECDLIRWEKKSPATYYIQRLETTEKKDLFACPFMQSIMQKE